MSAPTPETLWTDAQNETLKKLWGTVPAAAIGARIGKTKNAVLGRAHRMNLYKHPPGSDPRRPRPKRRHVVDQDALGLASVPIPILTEELGKRSKRVVAESREYLASPLPHHSRRWRPLIDCGSSDCRWPHEVRDLGKKAVLFCCAQVELGKSYCPEHLKRSMAQ
jgi:GcrA cell cycle regulator